MQNTEIKDHPMIGQTRTYRPDAPPYDADADAEPGVLIIGNGMPVQIKAVFENWNGIPGLDMLYVYCDTTGYHTHVTPRDLGMYLIVPSGLAFDCENPLTADSEEGYALSDCGWWDTPIWRRPWWAVHDCSGRVGDTACGVLCEQHFNDQP